MKYALRLRHCKYDLYLKGMEHGEPIFSTSFTTFNHFEMVKYMGLFPGFFKVVELSFPIS